MEEQIASFQAICQKDDEKVQQLLEDELQRTLRKEHSIQLQQQHHEQHEQHKVHRPIN